MLKIKKIIIQEGILVILHFQITNLIFLEYKNHFILIFYQSPYVYTIEVTNRFKGLDLVGRIPEELWTNFHNIVQEAVTKMIPKEKARRQLVV